MTFIDTWDTYLYFLKYVFLEHHNIIKTKMQTTVLNILVEVESPILYFYMFKISILYNALSWHISLW